MENIEEKTFLKILLISGTVLTIFFGILALFLDDKGASEKVCLHYSIEDLDIFNAYLVKYMTRI